MNLWRPVEHALAGAARVAWPVFQSLNRRVPSKTFQPAWAPGPLLKSHERSKPQLGWPRTHRLAVPDVRSRDARTHSVGRAVDRVARRRQDRRDPRADPRARRPDRHREDVPHARHVHRHARHRPGVSRSASRTCFPGRDYRAVAGTLHNHGTSSIQHGRGAVLTIDLTNRCNMMCDPCFMDANQVGYVHELTLDEVKGLLDDAISDQAAAADDGAVLGRRADDLADLPRRGPIRPRGRLLQRAGRDQRDSLRAGARVRRARRATPGCASRICSSTASARRPTRIARSATCSR